MFGGLENNLYICCEILTVANDVVENETTYQKLKRLSKMYNIQTNDPKIARYGRKIQNQRY